MWTWIRKKEKQKGRREGDIMNVGEKKITTPVINTLALEDNILKLEESLQDLSLTEKGLVIQEVLNRHNQKINKMKSQDIVNSFNMKDMIKGFMKGGMGD